MRWRATKRRASGPLRWRAGTKKGAPSFLAGYLRRIGNGELPVREEESDFGSRARTGEARANGRMIEKNETEDVPCGADEIRLIRVYKRKIGEEL